MDFYNCNYVNVIPFRNGNEYAESYKCEVTKSECKGCKCDLTQEQIDNTLIPYTLKSKGINEKSK